MFSLSSLSRQVLSGVAGVGRSLSRLPQPATGHRVTTALPSLSLFTRGRHQLAPKKVKHLKRHKGKVPIPIGGSTKGTTLAYGDWGIRIKDNGTRLSAKQLTTAREVIQKKLKVLKGAKVYLRVFPDIPVCIKGSETRMGKGKGTFEYWACRAPTGRVIFEIGGVPIREELARDILRQAAAKLPVKMEFISRSSPPRLGNLLVHPPEPPKVDVASIPEASSSAAAEVSA
ncbi:54S ribosomal protein L16 [Coprinopsis cinerea okayama7|uniref:54S ribosomal protein L16 n=1 Tax=Coprinopsis cinerea (strain Okayama-7 / 130 / ATCC MYA-4618 / FGSC 9003) TaxID=240176 RepID=A8PCA4_COPC7|nr:mitochondrial 54S ribosomal protein YmL47 [Coprinopsis cinerea okayama7\|eukprot:XP_001840351.1 mitochondrial 54S ribosomal protein YmL47 [Coprinopsis cinerea okayama7\